MLIEETKNRLTVKKKKKNKIYTRNDFSLALATSLEISSALTPHSMMALRNSAI